MTESAKTLDTELDLLKNAEFKEAFDEFDKVVPFNSSCMPFMKTKVGTGVVRFPNCQK